MVFWFWAFNVALSSTQINALGWQLCKLLQGTQHCPCFSCSNFWTRTGLVLVRNLGSYICDNKIETKDKCQMWWQVAKWQGNVLSSSSQHWQQGHWAILPKAILLVTPCLTGIVKIFSGFKCVAPLHLPLKDFSWLLEHWFILNCKWLMSNGFWLLKL